MFGVDIAAIVGYFSCLVVGFGVFVLLLVCFSLGFDVLFGDLLDYLVWCYCLVVGFDTLFLVFDL